jgi:hypothetical protein
MTKMTTEQETPKGLNLDFSGKFVVSVELAEGGIISFQVDDKEVMRQVLRVLLDSPEREPFKVSAQTPEEEQAYSTLFKLFPDNEGQP